MNDMYDSFKKMIEKEKNQVVIYLYLIIFMNLFFVFLYIYSKLIIIVYVLCLFDTINIFLLFDYLKKIKQINNNNFTILKEKIINVHIMHYDKYDKGDKNYYGIITQDKLGCYHYRKYNYYKSSKTPKKNDIIYSLILNNQLNIVEDNKLIISEEISNKSDFKKQFKLFHLSNHKMLYVNYFLIYKNKEIK